VHSRLLCHWQQNNVVGTKWLVYEIRQVEDYLQDYFINSTIYKIFTRRTHCRYITFDKVL